MTQAHSKDDPLPQRWDSVEGELAMERGHMPAWNAMIAQMEEKEISACSVLDFGCNRGGFLRTLYRRKPFRHGVGVDIATDALDDARRLAGDAPLTFGTHDQVSAQQGSFDFMFSHEVIYLLPDLPAHAAQAQAWLKPGGCYYLAIGEYAENPLWPRWDDIVRGFSPVKPQTYSLQYIARTFHDAGFSIAVSKLHCDGFFEYDVNDGKYLQSPIELVEFMTRYMMYFRLQKI